MKAFFSSSVSLALGAFALSACAGEVADPGYGSTQAALVQATSRPVTGYGYRRGNQRLPGRVPAVDARAYGVNGFDEVDDTAALQRAIDAVKGNPNFGFDSPVVLALPAGTIYLSDEVHVDVDGLIIEGRGRGPNGTKIIVRPPALYTNKNGRPEFDRKYWPGFAAFRVETRATHPRDPGYEGSVNFHWRSGVKVGPNGGGDLGSSVIQLASGGAERFAVGDTVFVGAANTVEFYQRMGVLPEDWINQHMRTQFFEVTNVDLVNNQIGIDRPLEFDLPYSNQGLIGGKDYFSRVMKVTSVKGVGFRNFEIETTLDHTPYASPALTAASVATRFENVAPEYAMHTFLFKFAEHGFVKNVAIRMSGSHPVVTEFASHMTFEDNLIDGSWNKGKGGNGYFRGSKLYYSLIQRNRIDNVRHLTLQWSATRNLVQHNDLRTDINLHGGWERYNRIENNTVKLRFSHREPTAPAGQGWYPIWIGAGEKAGGWSGATGPHNAFMNNTFFKEMAPNAGYQRWTLYTGGNTAYIFNWDGNDWSPLKRNGVAIRDWAGNENVNFAQAPHSGVMTGQNTLPPPPPAFGPTPPSTSPPAPAPAPPAQPPSDEVSTTVPGVLYAPGVIGYGQCLFSPQRRYRLCMQRDGNLVHYAGGRALWSSRTLGSGYRAAMQNDNNFVVYRSNGQAIWASQSDLGARNQNQRNDGGYLAVQDDGNVVVYNNRGQVTWASQLSP